MTLRPVTLRLIALLLFCGSLFAQEPAKFADPVRLKANGSFVNAVEKMPYPSPFFIDIDKDGTPELGLGDLWGRIWLHKKVGRGWGVATRLQVDGKELRVPNW